LFHRFDDLILLVICHFGEYREAETRIRSPLGMGKVAALMSHPGVDFLKVEGYGIIDHRLNFGIL
jgi:hypothetical protein